MHTLDELQQRIASFLSGNGVADVEPVALDDALGRVLAVDVQAAVSLPGADVSAMDGYAFRAGSDGVAAGQTLVLVGESVAGRPFAGRLADGECVRIMTGAVVPDTADTVEMQENVVRDGEAVVLQREVRRGRNIRYCGEELSLGECVLRAGNVLSAADILLLASLGMAQVQVKKRLSVAVLSTGDELVEPGQPLQAVGQLYDSNRTMLKALLRTLPVDVVDLGMLRDDLPLLKAALQQAAHTYDVIMTSGGVSVGDYDFLREAVAELGEIQAYKVKMKPGKPFVFGRIGRAVYFGLPGNPVSGFVGFSQIVRPALWQLAGAAPLPQALCLPALLTAAVRKQPGRRDFQRGLLMQEGAQWCVMPQGTQDSHRVYGLSRANCLIDLPEESGDLAAGESVTVWPFVHRWRGGD